MLKQPSTITMRFNPIPASTILGLLLSVGFMSDAQAQALSMKSDAIVWHVDSLTDVRYDSVMAYTCQFITDQSGKFRWIQEDGTFVTEFRIKTSTGTWTEVDKDGSRSLSVDYLDKKGAVQLSRVNGAIRVKIDYVVEGENALPYIFHVASVTKQK
jgi:hypothetical protein